MTENYGIPHGVLGSLVQSHIESTIPQFRYDSISLQAIALSSVPETTESRLVSGLSSPFLRGPEHRKKRCDDCLGFQSDALLYVVIVNLRGLPKTSCKPLYLAQPAN